jgi:hypothetical protein
MGFVDHYLEILDSGLLLYLFCLMTEHDHDFVHARAAKIVHYLIQQGGPVQAKQLLWFSHSRGGSRRQNNGANSRLQLCDHLVSRENPMPSLHSITNIVLKKPARSAFQPHRL